MKKRIHQIDLFLKYPHEVQRETFNKLLKNATNTYWGRKYGYKDIDNIITYRERVPLQDYDSLKPYIDRMRKGEQQVLWNTEVKWFAKSSGTTNDKSKFIPVSPESLEECHFKGGKDMLSIYCTNFPDTQLFTGKSLTLAGSLRKTEGQNTVFDGDLSAVIVQNLPLLAEFARTPSPEITLMDDWHMKIEKLAEATISENVTSILGVPSWMLLLLKYILQKTNKKNIGEVWPNLEVFFHGGINFNPYVKSFKSIIPDNVFYFETYNASEGFFGIQDQIDSTDLLLMLDYGIYYEFIPFHHNHPEYNKTCTLEEVELNKDYALVISTNGGLWRYQIGDTIRFTSLTPYRFKIIGRTKHFINAFGEELMIDNAEQALVVACEKTNASITEYTAAPVFWGDKESASHQWLIEFEKEPDDINFFGELLDNALKNLNSDYEAKRYGDLLLKHPQITLAPKGTFFNWLKKKNKLGGQFKVPRLSNDRHVMEEVLKSMNENS
ncbi:MAG: GH3 auxin-responsive promoter family protein [Bacteroidia bacterium]|nr:GH3 auxin-responsive promoter family protein [Bacteroidia bacterium]